MTEAEEDADLAYLVEEANALAEAANSPWEPRCISDAFAPSTRTFSLTIQAWVALDAIRSPVLFGRAPETQEEFSLALAAFGLEPGQALTAEEAAVLAADMCDAVVAGFSTVLPMRSSESSGSSMMGDGFGRWLPIFACLVVQCGLSPADANAMPVAQAYALLAAMRRNQGWKEAGTPYNLRDLDDEEPVAAEAAHSSPETTEEGIAHA